MCNNQLKHYYIDKLIVLCFRFQKKKPVSPKLTKAKLKRETKL